ncbi:hypothetical protein BDZ89DRAFT_1045230 [Hymenopellis radicata]|nr:hypothetical protein BDZ89DRAFT_1045230 [Hymenopellis radicata]
MTASSSVVGTLLEHGNGDDNNRQGPVRHSDDDNDEDHDDDVYDLENNGKQEFEDTLFLTASQATYISVMTYYHTLAVVMSAVAVTGTTATTDDTHKDGDHTTTTPGEMWTTLRRGCGRGQCYEDHATTRTRTTLRRGCGPRYDEDADADHATTRMRITLRRGHGPRYDEDADADNATRTMLRRGRGPHYDEDADHATTRMRTRTMLRRGCGSRYDEDINHITTRMRAMP